MPEGDRFICFIGIDGTGKTTQAHRLCNMLRANGTACVYIRPRYELAKRVFSKMRPQAYDNIGPRKTLSSGEPVSNLLKVLLTLPFAAYLLATYYTVVKPLTAKQIVVADRYFFDWFHNSLGKCSIGLLRLLPKPSLVFLLDLPVDVAEDRMTNTRDRNLPLSYYDSLRMFYLSIATEFDFIRIDATHEPCVISKIVFGLTKERLKGRKHAIGR